MPSIIKHYLKILPLFMALFSAIPTDVFAHGEKALEPFIRMRTIQWYDLQWSKTDLSVNDELVISGRFHVAEDWPINVPKPEATYLNVAAPGPVFIRTERYLNGQPTLNSFKLEEGGDYSFKVVLKARIPGRYHIHPFFNLHDAGAVVGPGAWVEIAGDADDFSNQVTLLNGETIDMESYGLGNAIYWHGFWILAGTAWLLWWLRRPLFIQRYRMLEAGQEDLLVTGTDNFIGKAILASVALIVIIGYNSAQQNHSTAIPLQAARDLIDPLPAKVNNGEVTVKAKKVVYSVPERNMQLKIELKNNTADALSIGEFSVANVRFINSTVNPVNEQNSSELLVSDGLSIDDISPIAAGETKTLTIEAKDAAWETEKLDGLIRDADSRMGGLLFLYGSEGKRHIVSLSAPVIPKFI